MKKTIAQLERELKEQTEMTIDQVDLNKKLVAEINSLSKKSTPKKQILITDQDGSILIEPTNCSKTESLFRLKMVVLILEEEIRNA